MYAINSAVPCRTGLILLILPRTSYGATFTPSLRDCYVLSARYPASPPMVLGEFMRVSPWSIFTFGVLGETGLRAAVPRMNGCTLPPSPTHGKSENALAGLCTLATVGSLGFLFFVRRLAFSKYVNRDDQHDDNCAQKSELEHRCPKFCLAVICPVSGTG
jgi:hypothetical protein